jgi:quercetin dioxygenase-like cupin family protein
MAIKHALIRIGQIEIKFLLQSTDTNGSVAMFEFIVPAGARVPAPHSHAQYDETIYGVEGVLTWTVEGKAVPIGPGESCFIRRGDVHGFRNLQSVDAKGLAVVTPALIGPEFFREMAAIVNAGGPPDIARIQETMLRHGLVPAPMEALTAKS